MPVGGCDGFALGTALGSADGSAVDGVAEGCADTVGGCVFVVGYGDVVGTATRCTQKEGKCDKTEEVSIQEKMVSDC